MGINVGKTTVLPGKGNGNVTRVFPIRKCATAIGEDNCVAIFPNRGMGILVLEALEVLGVFGNRCSWIGSGVDVNMCGLCEGVSVSFYWVFLSLYGDQ